MRKLWLLTILVALGGWRDMSAQIEEATLDMAVRPPSATTPQKSPVSLLAPHVKPTRVTLPRTVAPPQEPTGGGIAHPVLEVGYTLDAPPNLLGQARWERVELRSPETGRVWRGWACHLELYSENAVGLRLLLQGRPPSGVQMRVYDPNGSVVLPVRVYPDEAGNWWSPSLWRTEAFGLEVFVPEETDPQRLPEIVGIAYMYTGIEPQFEPAELGCHLDVTCRASHATPARGVARILYPEDGRNRLCTGQLMNRTGSDLAPIFSTAQHCISTQSSANGMEAFWFFQTATCNGTPPNVNTVPRTQGAKLLKQHINADWTLLGLYEEPEGDVFLGWTTADWPLGSSGSAIHHPAGTFKRVSFFTRVFGVSTGCQSVGGLWDTEITVGNGTIEGGSSGSAALDSDLRLRGICSCAETAGNDANGNPIWECPTAGDPLWVGWGRIAQAFDHIRYYIFEMANPTYVDRSVNGDTSNNGNSERGTSANPFNQVYEATFCVPSGGTVRIVPGNYNEQFTLWRPMTLRREGSSGVVQIGAP
ncbi:hypothetical protein GBSOP10_109947 [Armatimonadetes bacterium GBS]|jgi:hypothetical protein|nr:hypothetical protein GBSOP10_109947 [Armatimonadetes bacterium GBS]